MRHVLASSSLALPLRSGDWQSLRRRVKYDSNVFICKLRSARYKVLFSVRTTQLITAASLRLALQI